MSQDEIATLCKRLRMFCRRDAHAAANVIEALVARLAHHQRFVRGLDDLAAMLAKAVCHCDPRRCVGQVCEPNDGSGRGRGRKGIRLCRVRK